MINKTELRIGNKVLLNGKIINVEGLCEAGINPQSSYGGDPVYPEYLLTELNPIAVTPEILEKAGFKEERQTFFTWY